MYQPAGKQHRDNTRADCGNRLHRAGEKSPAALPGVRENRWGMWLRHKYRESVTYFGGNRHPLEPANHYIHQQPAKPYGPRGQACRVAQSSPQLFWRTGLSILYVEGDPKLIVVLLGWTRLSHEPGT